MLIKPVSAVTIAVLTAGAAIAVDTAPAWAGGGGGKTKGTGLIQTTVTTPGRAPTGGHGGGGGSGKAAQMPCPAGAVCGQATLGVNPPPPAALPATQVAMEARAAILLPQPVVSTSPANRTYVQLKTGLLAGGYEHIDQPFGLGGTTVVLSADPKFVTWNMGESTLTCHSAGSLNGRTCGYAYNRSSASQPNGKYRISATINWYLYWRCTGGNCDAAGGDWGADSMEARTTGADLAVGEVQTESRPG